MEVAAIALGSNLGKRQTAVRAAVERLRLLPRSRLLALATFRQTEPVDTPADSPAFVNSAVTLETQLPPEILLRHLLEIERELGRTRDPAMRNLPRTIDLDLLVYGQAVVDSPSLKLPHPRMHQRLFVLEPLVEIAPDLVHPTLHKTMRELRDELLASQGMPRPTAIETA